MRQSHKTIEKAAGVGVDGIVESTTRGDSESPFWHQKEERVLSHILVCFLAYVLWKTLGQMVKASGLGDEPRRVLDELSKISLVDVVLPTSSGVEIRKRCITRPTEHQEILLQRLGLKLPRQFKK